MNKVYTPIEIIIICIIHIIPIKMKNQQMTSLLFSLLLIINRNSQDRYKIFTHIIQRKYLVSLREHTFDEEGEHQPTYYLEFRAKID